MLHRIPSLLPAAAALTAAVTVALPALAIEPTTVARRLEPGMVQVVVEGPELRAGASGFVVSDRGHVATNYHVLQRHIEMGWQLYVIESGAPPETRRPAEVLGAYPEEDMAVLKVEGLARTPLVLSEAPAESLAQGTRVFAIGYPGAGGRLGAGGGTSFTAGMASRIFTGAWTAESSRIRIIQHSAATNPGNSGGPIVNACGQVVGLNTEREMAMVITPTGLPLVYDVIQGVFFASHVSVLEGKLRELGVAYNGSAKTCRVIFGVASVNYPWYAAAALGLLLLAGLLVFRHWPRRVVHVVVVGGATARDGARRLGHLILHPRERGRPHKVIWRLHCDQDGGGPIDIEIDEEALRHAPEGMVIGSDQACDRCLAADGIDSRHARLLPAGDGTLAIKDLHSKTGTAVDAKPLDPEDGAATLKPGAELRLGNLVFRVERK